MRKFAFLFSFFYCSFSFCQTKSDCTFLLDDFTKHPISSFSIWSGYAGCYVMSNNSIQFLPVSDSIFTSKTFVQVVSFPTKETTENYTKEINVKDLISLIDIMISNSNTIPKLRDFKISEVDKQNYLNDLKTNLDENKVFNINKSTKKFFKNVPKLLETLNDSIIVSILNEEDKYTKNTSNRFELLLVNRNNDTLKVSQNYYIHYKYFNNYWMTPGDCHWNYTWTISLNGKTQKCSNFNFSTFIYSLLPNNFYGKEKFDNKNLIFRIGEYLYNKYYHLDTFFKRN